MEKNTQWMTGKNYSSSLWEKKCDMGRHPVLLDKASEEKFGQPKASPLKAVCHYEWGCLLTIILRQAVPLLRGFISTTSHWDQISDDDSPQAHPLCFNFLKIRKRCVSFGCVSAQLLDSSVLSSTILHKDCTDCDWQTMGGMATVVYTCETFSTLFFNVFFKACFHRIWVRGDKKWWKKMKKLEEHALMAEENLKEISEMM